MVRVPGSHIPNIKNRSSKQNFKLTKIKSCVRSWSNEKLAKSAFDIEVSNEIKRRAKKRAKKESK